MLAKHPNGVSDERLHSWFKMRADHGEDDVVLADTGSLKEWEKTDDYKTIRRLRGIIGKLDDALQAGDHDYYNRMRPRVVKPLKNDVVWDGGLQLRAGDVPPPRTATKYQPVQGKWERTTRRDCSRGLIGLPCDHIPGSNVCNGGVQAVRRIGENY